MTKGDLLVEHMKKYLGVHETGNNTGPVIDGWESRWGMHGEPWCGFFVDAMFAEVGIDDGNCMHPATAEICNRARAKGYVWNGKGLVPTGAQWVKCGTHVCTVIKDFGNGVLSCIDGNHNNAVAYSTRNAHEAGVTMVVVPSILESVGPPPPKYVTDYYLQDTLAKPYIYRVASGKVPQWKSQTDAQRVANKLSKHSLFKGKNPRVVRLGNGNYGIALGALRDYGPWNSVNKRKQERVKLEARLGHKVRPYSKKRKVN